MFSLATDGRELRTQDNYIPSDSAPRPHKQTTPMTPISHIPSVATQYTGLMGSKMAGGRLEIIRVLMRLKASCAVLSHSNGVVFCLSLVSGLERLEMLASSSFWPIIVRCRECNPLCAVGEDGREVRQVVGRVCLPRFPPIAEPFQQQGEDDPALGFPFACLRKKRMSRYPACQSAGSLVVFSFCVTGLLSLQPRDLAGRLFVVVLSRFSPILSFPIVIII